MSEPPWKDSSMANEEKYPHELIADLPAKDLVLKALADREVLPKGDPVMDSSDDLDLVRISLNLDGYGGPGAGDGQSSKLDLLLADLRNEFAASGFVPVMGKNREAVVGFPKHKATPEPPIPVSGAFAIPVTSLGYGVEVGVVDTAIADHDAVPVGIVDGDRLTDVDSVSHFSAHATFIAGLIRLAAPGAHLTVRAGLDHREDESNTWDAAKQVASFRNGGVRLLNLSFGCVTADNEPPLLLRRALDRLGSDILVIASAGNRNADEDAPEFIWPAASPGVVAVGATPEFGANGKLLTDFSMQRSWVQCVADGYQVHSAYPFGRLIHEDLDDKSDGQARWSGTSFSAATVTGSIAARLTPDVSAREVLDDMLKNGHAAVKPYPVPVG